MKLDQDDDYKDLLEAKRLESIEPDDGEDWEVLMEGHDMPVIVPAECGRPWQKAIWPGGFGIMCTRAMYCFDEATGKYTIEGNKP